MLLGAPTPISAESRAAPVATGPESQTRPFFERILAPVGPGAYLNLHRPWIAPSGGKPQYPGTAYDSVESAVADLHKFNWIARQKNQTYEQYFYCLSTQGRAEPKTSQRGRPYLKAVRAQANTVGVKTLFADIDVKPKAFPTQEAALRALMALVHANEVPPPTMVVNSGNGLHVYWTLNRPLAHDEWTPLAEGFGRFLTHKGIHQDSIYSNSVCLLRPPGAWNTKDPANPKQVRIVGRILPHDYDPSMFQAYAPFRTVAVHPAWAGLGASQGKDPARPDSNTTTNPVGQGAVQSVVAAGPGGAHTAGGSADTHSNVVALLPRLPAITPSGELSAGLEHLAQPVSMAVAVERCAVLRDVAARGGNGDPEPFWRQVLLAASFDPNAREWAHKLSSGDPRYTPEATDAKLDTILHQRTQGAGKIGWPTCATFSRHSSACQQCPYQGRIKSPFNIAPDDSDLPPGYSRKKGMIWKDKADVGENGEAIPSVAFPYGLRDAYLEPSMEGLVLNTELVHPHEPPRRMRIPVGAINAWRDKIAQIFGMHSIAMPKAMNHLAQEFLVSFVHHLQTIAATGTRRDAVGWTKTRDGSTAFGFGGKAWTASGRFENTAGIDPAIEDRYTVRGDFAPWKVAADFITNMRRLDLQVILASAFAAPLVRFTGQTGLLLSAYSPQSGVQKSTAMQVAQAVWAHPVRAMNRIDDTYNSVANKLGVLRHLPIYWDELQTPDQAEIGFAKMAFTLTQGTEKGRLGADIQQRNSGSWATMLVSASNFSVQDMMQRGAKNTAAGLNRVFEVLVQPAPSSVIISASQANAIIAECQEHFGHAGERFAQALARDEAKTKARLLGVAAAFEKATNAAAEERFWVFSAATLFLGAAMAKAEGLVDFDLPGLQAYLTQAIVSQRAAKARATYDVTSADYAAAVLSRYIQHCRARNAYLETNIFAASRIGGPALEVKLAPDAARQLRAPILHLARDSGVIRFLRQEFHDWLATEGLPASAVISALTRHGGMAQSRPAWGAGTEWSVGRVYCFEMKLTGGSAPTDAVGNFFQYGLKPHIQGTTP